MNKIAFKGSCMLNPVPAVLVTSRNKSGKVNVFTAAWVGTVCTKPPMISISIRPDRLSYEYIKETKEFSVNLPSSSMTRVLDFCGVKSGRNTDKIKACKFNLKDSTKINVPYIENCPVNLECKVKNIIPLGSHHLFLSNILSVNVDENVISKNGKIHLEKANLICYSHGEYFKISSKPSGKFGYSVKRKK
ncbi:flavin reductase family protein [Clostridium tyrobutyricum]|jgi:flavin reductase (DIM6/NTAB) family NADH-FMN oxidoreductase RutF|uniref:Flavoredoxin n=1 Tax=Clostridium tyrobutyricum DIVETGP TaxID=1408889 RepID=W6N8Y4_CLOTY|nr:flavin reductase family protein [Clostridium tyrobutyricum]AND85790.1 flavin reductase-like protein [Clostridium tyrobutyricum]ANP70307.1 flavin reductase [Clostridium tyrobutyricum]MBR9648001.1 flavin reductase family protein [Clostridium tyrobutyricum]MBV4416388.1 flavin reductase family protein [Clostridium tyrobutyricum]MBV4424521.1 flavin reductase family protein [Clostridium tyrobutyricum]